MLPKRPGSCQIMSRMRYEFLGVLEITAYSPEKSNSPIDFERYLCEIPILKRAFLGGLVSCRCGPNRPLTIDQS